VCIWIRLHCCSDMPQCCSDVPQCCSDVPQCCSDVPQCCLEMSQLCSDKSCCCSHMLFCKTWHCNKLLQVNLTGMWVHCNRSCKFTALQHSITYCNTLQHTTLQHTTLQVNPTWMRTHCNRSCKFCTPGVEDDGYLTWSLLQHGGLPLQQWGIALQRWSMSLGWGWQLTDATLIYCNKTMQQTATLCNTLQPRHVWCNTTSIPSVVEGNNEAFDCNNEAFDCNNEAFDCNNLRRDSSDPIHGTEIPAWTKFLPKILKFPDSPRFLHVTIAEVSREHKFHTPGAEGSGNRERMVLQ